MARNRYSSPEPGPNDTVTVAPEPIPVTVDWYPGSRSVRPARLEAVAVAWTRDLFQVRLPDGLEDWVLAGDVTRR